MSALSFDTQVRLHVYRHFVDTGHPPTPLETARELGAEPAQVEAALQRLHEARALVLLPGRYYVWMANPLSAVPTEFRVEAGGRDYWGNCIWDALGVLAMLAADGRVKTRCPDCGDRLELEVRDGELQPSETRVHFLVPARRWWEDIGHT